MNEREAARSPLFKDMDISALEADVAYFEARLSLASNVENSLYQRAQLRAYSALETSLAGTLKTLRRGLKKRL